MLFITLIDIPFIKNLLETNFQHFFYLQGNNKKMADIVDIQREIMSQAEKQSNKSSNELKQ